VTRKARLEKERVLRQRLDPFKRANQLGEDDETGEGIHLSFTDLMALLLVFFVLFFSLTRPEPTAQETQPVTNRLNQTIDLAALQETRSQQSKSSLVARFSGASSAWAEGMIAEESRAKARVNLDLVKAEAGLDPNLLASPRQKTFDQLASAGTSLPADLLPRPRRTEGPSDQDRLLTQMRSLQASLPELGLGLRTEDKAVILSIGEAVTFEEGRAEILPQFRNMLIKLSEKLNTGFNLSYIRIRGHTDTKPISNSIFPSNWELSGARAASVARLLIEEGLDPHLIEITGNSQYRPVADNSSAAGRSLNRRVEIELITAG